MLPHIHTPEVDTLTPHQQEAFDTILGRLADGAAFTSLQGYAGTGKTYLIARLVEHLIEDGERVYVCAPTHKAAQVLREKIDDDWVTAQTIHAFLGLKLVPDRKGGYELVPEPFRDLPRSGIVLVDEASMIGEDEWTHIQAADHLQWLFVGDPAQLPPVNEGASPALEVEGAVLEEVVRQARENPILDLATQVREGAAIRWQAAMRGREGIGVTGNPEAFLASALRAFQSKAFEKDATHARVLAYRNRTVEAYNRAIRQVLFDDAPGRFVKGEWLVAQDTWYDDGVPYLINSEEVRVVHAAEDDDVHLKTGAWKVWLLEVKRKGERRVRYLTVLHEDEFTRYGAELTALRKAAKKNDKKWDAYYALRERFARVDYAYSSTIHKAQGSTYHTAFVDRRDATACRGPERQALLYVAITRPAKRLALLV